MVSEAKYTPGPWSTAEWPSRGKDYIQIFAGTTYVGSVGNSDDPFERFERTGANARLIAAAPDLLAACEAVISAGESENLPTTVCDAVEAAIAKANGGGK